MAEVLLAHSYLLRHNPHEWRLMRPYPPLGTLYDSAVLRRRGYSVALFDPTFARDESELGPVLERERPALLALCSDTFSFQEKMCLGRTRQAALAMARMGQAAGARVVAAGSDPVDHLEAYLGGGVDVVICGEVEQTLAELADALLGRSGAALERVAGLALRDPTGTIRRTPARPLLRDLDALPLPARDLCRLEAYRRAWRRKWGFWSLNVSTTRGCPWRCNWCAKPVYGRAYHMRSPASVVTELLELKRDHSPEQIWFTDDIFALEQRWLTRFARLVREAGAVIPFKCLSRVDLLTEQAVVDLRAAGCEEIWTGAESGSQKVLDAMDKDITVEQTYAAAERCHRHGIRIAFFLQYGYPGERREDIERTWKLLADTGPDDIGVSIAYPLPGTVFYEQVKDQLRADHWDSSMDNRLLFRGTYAPEFYRTLRDYTHAYYKTVRGRAGLRRALRRPGARAIARAALDLAVGAARLPALRRRLDRLERAQ